MAVWDWPGLIGGEPRGHVGVARKFGVKGLQPAPRAEQQRRSLAAETRGEGDMAPNEVRTCSLEVVERSGLRGGQEPQRRVKHASLEACLRRGQCTLRTSRRICCKCHGALQKRSCRGHSAASLRPTRRTLQLGGDLLARSGCGAGQVPGAPVRVGLGVGCVG